MTGKKGYVSKIQRFSVHDGDGVRTTVFLKGCNLRCLWCHNPETIHPGVAIQTYFDAKCIGCGECFKVCPQGAHVMKDNEHIIDRSKCVSCGECAKVCYAGAIVSNGEAMSADEVIAEVVKDKEFYSISGGGMTISGGEPMLQIDFVKELLTKAKENNISTAIDTAGNVDFSCFEEINPMVDLYLFDIKSMDEDIHEKITTVSNKRILENLQKLDKIAKKIYIRMPIMNSMNDKESMIEDAAKFIEKLSNVWHVDILSIHKLASGKYKSLDMDYSIVEASKPLEKEKIEKFIEIFASHNVKALEN